MKISKELLATIFSSFIALFGVFVMHWNNFDIVIYYWFESFFITVFSLLKAPKAVYSMYIWSIPKEEQNNCQAGKKVKTEMVITSVISAIVLIILAIGISMKINFNTYLFSSIWFSIISLLILKIFDYYEFISDEIYKKISFGGIIIEIVKRLFVMVFLLVIIFAGTSTEENNSIYPAILVFISVCFDFYFYFQKTKYITE